MHVRGCVVAWVCCVYVRNGKAHLDDECEGRQGLVDKRGFLQTLALRLRVLLPLRPSEIHEIEGTPSFHRLLVSFRPVSLALAGRWLRCGDAHAAR